MGVSIPPLYINETVPTEIKGRLGCLVQFQIAFGIFISYSFCIILPVYNLDSEDNYLWIIIFGFPIIPSLIQLFIYWFSKDTPKWLPSENRSRELEEILKTISIQDWENHLEGLKNACSKSVKTEDNKSQNKNPGYLDLFKDKQFRKPLILACIQSVFQQFSGINMFTFYSTSIYDNLENTKNYASSFTAGLGCFNMLATMVCLPFVDKYGRKIMMMQGCIGMCASYLVLFFLALFNAPSVFALPIMLIYIAFFESSLGSVIWIYFSETLTDRGIGIAVAINWIFTGIIGLFPLFLELLDNKIAYAFLIFACICITDCFYIYFFLPETKERKEEIN